MTVRTVACANCGARYRIPESFQGAKARCKACGAAIEIANSIVPDAPPAAAKPATERPAPKASEQKAVVKPAAKPAARAAAKPTRSASAAKSRTATSRGKATTAANDGDEGDAPRRAGARSTAGRAGARASAGAARARRGEDSEAAKSKAPLFAGIGIGVAVLGVAAYFLMSGKGDEQGTKKDNQAVVEAPKNEEGSPATSTKDAAKAEEAVAKKDAASAKDAKEASAKTDADAGAKESAKADAAAEASKKDAPKAVAEKGEAKKPEAIVTPFDARTELSDLDFPADVDEATAKEFAELAKTAVEDDSLHGQRALRSLKEKPRLAFVALANALRVVDYTSTEQAEIAFSVHKAIEEMLEGQNFPFKVTAAGEDVKPADAYWNAKCVRLMQDFYNKSLAGGTQEGWDNWIKNRRRKLAEAEKKKAEAGKEDGGDDK